METLQWRVNWDLLHTASGSSSSIFQELSFVKDLALTVAMPTHILMSLCSLGNYEPKTVCQRDCNRRATSQLPHLSLGEQMKSLLSKRTPQENSLRFICFQAAQNQH